MNLIDKENVALFEIGEQRGQIACFGDDRSRGHLEVHAKLAGHNLPKRRLAKAGRPGEQHMIECVATAARGVDEHLEVRARLGLADEFGQPQRAQR